MRLFALVLSLCLAVFVTDAQADGRWLRGESASFVVYTDAGEAALRRQIANLETYDAVLRAFTTAPAEHTPRRLEIYMLRSIASLHEVSGPHFNPNTAGFYSAGPETVAAFVHLDNSDSTEAQHILFHEYAHHFMFQYFPNAYPSWYSEGFAEYFAPTTIRGNQIEVGVLDPPRAQILVNASWMPLQRLLTESPQHLNALDGAKYYAESWLLVHYLYNNPDRLRAFKDYHAALISGVDPAAAFSTAFGASIEAFETELKQYSRHGLSYSRLSHFDAVVHEDVSITTLPPSADDLLLLQARLRLGPTREELPALLARAREQEARFPGDSMAETVLAHAAIANEDFAQAHRTLDALASSHPDDNEAEYLRGLCALSEARDAATANDAERLYAEARRHFGRVHNADPNDPRPLYNYAEAEMRPGHQDNALDVILLAHAISPQVSDYGFVAAAMLMERQRFDEAIHILRPIAYAPHEDREGTARRYLAAAEHHETAPSDPEAPPTPAPP